MTLTPVTSTTETRIAAGGARTGGTVGITGAGTATVTVGIRTKGEILSDHGRCQSGVDGGFRSIQGVKATAHFRLARWTGDYAMNFFAVSRSFLATLGSSRPPGGWSNLMAKASFIRVRSTSARALTPVTRG